MSLRADSPAPSDKSDSGEDLREGIELFRKGEYRRVVQTLAQLLEVEASTAIEACRWSAQAHAKLGAHEKAEVLLQTALKRVPELPICQQARASSTIKLRIAANEQWKGNDVQAQKLQKEAIASLELPQPAETHSLRQNRLMSLGSAWNNLGITLTRMGEYVQAKDAFSKALEIRFNLADKEGYCLAASNLLALQGQAEGFSPKPDFLKQMEEHLQKADQMGASAHLLRPLRINFANACENAKAWQTAARARRLIFGLNVSPEELRLNAKCESCRAHCPRLRCSRCRQAFFCDAACQQQAWPSHRYECAPHDESTLASKATQDCPICLEAMLLNCSTEKHPVLILECLHILHSACWESLVQARETDLQCPVCRDPLAMSA